MALFDAGIVIIEGLNLSHVSPGRYELICAPLKVKDGEGAPARVFLRDL
jgi:arylformamidase